MPRSPLFPQHNAYRLAREIRTGEPGGWETELALGTVEVGPDGLRLNGEHLSLRGFGLHENFPSSARGTATR